MPYKIPGIIGGVGPASTLDYYTGIVNGYREKCKDDSYPNIIIKSVDMTKMISFLEKKDYDGLVLFLNEHIQNLKNAGANFAAIASNTPHIVFEQLKTISPLPLVSIIEETCLFALKNDYKNVLILGTKFIMQSSLYSAAFKKHKIKSVCPNDKEIEIVHSIIFPKLEEGIVVKEDKEKMILLANKICYEQNVDAVVLGCTEIPLMIKPGDLNCPIINTTHVHINAILKKMFEK